MIAHLKGVTCGAFNASKARTAVNSLMEEEDMTGRSCGSRKHSDGKRGAPWLPYQLPNGDEPFGVSRPEGLCAHRHGKVAVWARSWQFTHRGAAVGVD